MKSWPGQLTARERLASIGLRLLPIRNGKHRLLTALMPVIGDAPQGRRYLSWGRNRIVVEGADLVGRQFLILRTFDPEVVEVIGFFVGDPETAVVWDVGANLGTFTYQFIKRFPIARVVAIEPQEDLASIISENLEKLHTDRFEVFDVAIGAENAEMLLEIPATNRGAATLNPELLEDHEQSTTAQIRTVTADWIFNHSDYGWPTLVKLDIQGHESVAIHSLIGALRSGIPRAVVFEHIDNNDNGWLKIENDFRSSGYNVFGIFRSAFITKLVPTAFPIRGVNDYVAVRRDLVEIQSETIRIPRLKKQRRLG